MSFFYKWDYDIDFLGSRISNINLIWDIVNYIIKFTNHTPLIFNSYQLPSMKTKNKLKIIWDKYQIPRERIRKVKEEL